MDVISFSYAHSKHNLRDPLESRALPLAEFVRAFAQESYHIAKAKTDLPIWSPALYRGTSRVAADVLCMNTFVCDLDSLDLPTLRGHMARWSAQGRHYLVHSSYNYAPPAVAKVRAIFFFDCPLPIRSSWEWTDALWPALVGELGLSGVVDIACKDASRGYFMPARRSSDAPVLFEYYPGANIDTSTSGFLGAILAAPVERYSFTREYVSQEDSAVPVDPGDLAYRLRTRFRKGKLHDTIETVLSFKALPYGASRHPVVCDFTRALAIVARPEEASEQMLDIMRPWLAVLNTSNDTGRDWYSEALSALKGARAKLPSWQARYEYERQQQMKLRDLVDLATREDSVNTNVG